MNSKLNSAIRLTDALERELIARAIAEQNDHYLDGALKTLSTKIVALFKGPQVTIHTTQGSH